MRIIQQEKTAGAFPAVVSSDHNGSGFFTALSDGLTSALISFLRTLVFETAAVMLLPLVLGINGIWWSIVIAELMASLLCFLFVALKKKRFGY